MARNPALTSPVEGVAAGCGCGDGFVVERFALGRRGQQQDAQVGHGDARRADEDILPGRLECLCRAAVVDDACRAEGRGLEEDPCHGEVRGEVDPGDGRCQEHDQCEIAPHLAQVAAAQVGLRVGEGVDRYDGEQHEEERAGGVEAEGSERGGVVAPSEGDPEGEGRLDGVERHARQVDLPFVAGGECRGARQNACDEVVEHGVSPLHW